MTIPSKYRTKMIRSTRTYEFNMYNDLNDLFLKVQSVQNLYFNYALKYLYQHHGVKHLSNFLPKGTSKQYFINKLKRFARTQSIKKHHVNLQNMDYSSQSIDKLLDQLLINFDEYRKKQYSVHNYWTDKQKKQYLKEHNNSLSGYGRIHYRHNVSNCNSVTFKQNHDRIRVISNYCLRIPYFGRIHTIKSISSFKHKRIVEAKIIKRKDNTFRLQIVIKFKKKKCLSKQDLENPVGMDLNLADNQFFEFSEPVINPNEHTWPSNVAAKFYEYDRKYRKYNHIINNKHDNDNSKQEQRAKTLARKFKHKASGLLDNWYKDLANLWVQRYPVLIIEQLSSFDMRKKKKDNETKDEKKKRKNINKKLARVKPYALRKILEYVYQDAGKLLIEVDPRYTSMTCHKCGYINHDLKVGEKAWTCPNCHNLIIRDPNATLNIRDWGVDPKKHSVLQEDDTGYYTPDMLVSYY